MARIAGIDIPREKRVEIALTYVYGIGLTRSKLILANTGVNPDIRVKDLSDSDVQKLRGATEEFTLEGVKFQPFNSNFYLFKTRGQDCRN